MTMKSTMDAKHFAGADEVTLHVAATFSKLLLQRRAGTTWLWCCRSGSKKMRSLDR